MPLKILVIQTAFTGDVILATPVLDTLAKAFPEAQIDMLVRKGNESLLLNFPGLRKVIVWDKKNGKFRNLITLLSEIRTEQYDHVINLQRFASSGLLTLLSKAKETSGFDKNPFSNLFDHKIKHRILPGNTRHEVDRNLELISHLTLPVTRRPVLYPSSTDIQKVEPFTNYPFVTFAPASVWFTKQFPAEKWIDLGKAILKKSSADSWIYLVGGPGDRKLCDTIQQAVSDSRMVTLAGSLSFLETAALMKKATMNYVNDSAPLHIASSMNAPVTAFFCSTVPWFGFGPLSDKRTIAETPLQLDCRPCGLHGYKSCPKKHFKCALSIAAENFAINL